MGLSFNFSLRTKMYTLFQFGCVGLGSPLKLTESEPSSRKTNSPPAKLDTLFLTHLQSFSLSRLKAVLKIRCHSTVV